jgi:MFS transporter, ACS family, hexuronate transporter
MTSIQNPAIIPVSARAPFPSMKIPHLRWIIAAALLIASVLNYIDRSVFAIIAPDIQTDLKISDTEYGHIASYFMVAYCFAYLASGWIVDRLGVRLSLALFVAWWSISNALTGFGRSIFALTACRFSLGLGEAGVWTAAPKAVGEWFPPAERGVAVGFYSIGGALGATVAPLLVSTIAPVYGWHAVFWVTPIFAFLWLGIWLILYRPPAKHPWITDEERARVVIPETTAPHASKLTGWAAWRAVLSQPFIWALILARLLTDPVWYFLQTWLPKYLYSAQHLDKQHLWVLSVIFLAADAGFLGGGFLAGFVMKRGLAAPAARLTVMAGSACVVPLAFFVPFVHGLDAVVALAMAVACGTTCWLGNLTALVVDLVPKPILGTSFGLIAGGSALGGIFMNQIVGSLAQKGLYSEFFYLMALLHPLALLLLWSLRKRPVAT